MRKAMFIILVGYVLMNLTGCAAYYCNYDAVRNFNSDYAMCEKYAESGTPLPNINYNYQNPNKSGIFTGVDMHGNHVTGIYHSYDNAAANMNTINAVNGLLGMANASLDKSNALEMCMKSLGYSRVSKPIYDSFIRCNYRPFTQDEGQRFMSVLRSRLPKKYVNPDQTTHINIMKWIMSQDDNYRDFLLDLYLHSKDGGSYCDVVERYIKANPTG